MRLPTLPSNPKIILFLVILVLSLGSLTYGGYLYYQSRQPAPQPQPSTTEQPQSETKPYEIITNPDGSQTLINHVYKYRITIPAGWELPKFPEGDSDYAVLINYTLIDWAIGVHLRAQPTEAFSCDCPNEGTPSKLTIQGEDAIVCDYIPLQPTQYGARRLTFSHNEINYLILIEPYKFIQQTDYQGLMDSFEFLE